MEGRYLSGRNKPPVHGMLWSVASPTVPYTPNTSPQARHSVITPYPGRLDCVVLEAPTPLHCFAADWQS